MVECGVGGRRRRKYNNNTMPNAFVVENNQSAEDVKEQLCNKKTKKAPKLVLSAGN